MSVHVFVCVSWMLLIIITGFQTTPKENRGQQLKGGVRVVCIYLCVCTRWARLKYTLCLVNNFRHCRAIAIWSTNSETRILGYFADIPHNKIAQQMAEIFELKEKSSILTCILRVFSVHFENFGRLYLLKY